MRARLLGLFLFFFFFFCQRLRRFHRRSKTGYTNMFATTTETLTLARKLFGKQLGTAGHGSRRKPHRHGERDSFSWSRCRTESGRESTTGGRCPKTGMCGRRSSARVTAHVHPAKGLQESCQRATSCCCSAQLRQTRANLLGGGSKPITPSACARAGLNATEAHPQKKKKKTSKEICQLDAAIPARRQLSQCLIYRHAGQPAIAAFLH